jgi:hypothetical protein
MFSQAHFHPTDFMLFSRLTTLLLNVTTVVIYMLLMSFSQKEIDKLQNFQEHLRMRHPDGEFEGLMMVCSISAFRAQHSAHVVNKALLWFKEHFIKCNGRAALVKTWLPAQYEMYLLGIWSRASVSTLALGSSLSSGIKVAQDDTSKSLSQGEQWWFNCGVYKSNGGSIVGHTLQSLSVVVLLIQLAACNEAFSSSVSPT